MTLLPPPTPWLATSLLLLLALGGTPGSSAAQEGTSRPQTAERHLGVLFWHPSPNDFAALEGIRRGLTDAGIRHRLEVREAKEDEATARRILGEFEAAGVELVFALGTRAALLAAEELESTPIVFTAVTSPVESGLVPSWEGSGRNLAGNSNWVKPRTLVRVFQLAVPGLERLGILRSRRSGLVSGAELQGMRRFLESDGAPRLELVEEVVEDPLGLPRAVQRLLDAGVQALWIPIDFEVYENLDRVLDTLGPGSIPLVSSSVKGAQAGAVAGVLADYQLLGRRAVVLARAILEEGLEPWRLPIETMQGSQVVVNLSAARRCGYELPLSLLVLADRILEEEPEL